ncbi:uncharacterized protein EV154DRAFT_562578 [Mucor mucedo]|uniref:uncharacterized protein n=1 Tax=Mucor mucedo TaxID=29922 RepID=UPI00221EC8B7|nr:uncharacterized protein EV154DRAFT_562578 [Mucor mucedo]KAI7892147.1 hypothetical protein EV154DRAFT_562578 [Mucor mucedo]
MEVGCGEVKKPGVSQALLNEDKMRVLEVMKRQLHLRLFHAKKGTYLFYKGTTVILLKMQIDLENGEYMYHEEHHSSCEGIFQGYPSIFPRHTDKGQMSKSLAKEEDKDCQGIWDQYEFHVRPTVSHFEPIYHN